MKTRLTIEITVTPHLDCRVADEGGMEWESLFCAQPAEEPLNYPPYSFEADDAVRMALNRMVWILQRSPSEPR